MNSSIWAVGRLVIRPDLDPSWYTTSEWAIGPHAWPRVGSIRGLDAAPQRRGSSCWRSWCGEAVGKQQSSE
jgi:hypothetical protein